ncbi:MAG: hypothetical protein KIS67_16310 [Verrucomicrobiae bacterium]|nr:hypothetical protein [Verrucomicrobiae bacterium]
MPFAQANCASAVVNGKLYILGGTAFLRVYEYNPGSDSWLRKSDAPTALDSGGAGVVDGKIYVISPNAKHNVISNCIYQIPQRRRRVALGRDQRRNVGSTAAMTSSRAAK